MHNQSGPAILEAFLPPYYCNGNAGRMGALLATSSQEVVFLPTLYIYLLYIFFLLLCAVSTMTLVPKGPPSQQELSSYQLSCPM